MARALDLERANAAPDRSAEIISVGAAPLVTTGSRPARCHRSITLEGRSVRKGVAPDRDQAADAVSDTLDELPASSRRCDPRFLGSGLTSPVCL